MRCDLERVEIQLTHGAHYDDSLEVGWRCPVEFQVVQGQGRC